ncbi:MAG: DUF6776 family protein, partial [Rhodoferax sp.]
MRFRLLRRRLTISAPRMAVRSAMPWPLRWALLAIVLGFCAAIGLWAFEFGKDIAGLDNGSKEELARLRGELLGLRGELAQTKEARDRAQAVADTANTLMTTEKAAQERVLAQVKQLELENQRLRDDLGFFEKLIPAANGEGVGIRGLQAELQNGGKLKWQVLVIQASKNAQEFTGRLEVAVTGLLNGKPWSATLPGGALPLKVRQYGRLEGEFELPPQVQAKGVTVRVLEGEALKATQSIK